MEKSFLGVGWRFPIALEDEDGASRVAMARFEDSIRQAIWIILATARGERQMRPDFGCGIHELVFAPGSAETVGRVAGEVRRSLIQWEPRIDVLGVSAAPDTEAPNHLLISIEYRVRATNNRFNLVYPFYLES